MAKKDLIGGSLWEQYSNKVADRMNAPAYMGEISEEEAEKRGMKLIIADWGAEACGDAVRLYWLVDPETEKIEDARFKSFGCGTAIASSDVMAELSIGKTVDEALKITNIDVEHVLRDDPDKAAIPPQKMHCSVMAYDVIKKAASIYKGVDVESFEEEEIVCECARVPLKTIQDVIRVNDLKTVEEITQYTKAGAFCKSCIRPGGHEERKYYLVDILRQTREKMQLEAARALEGDERDFTSMTLIQKHRVIEKVLDEKIRKILLEDGGSLEVMDMNETDNGRVSVYIQYYGACAGCASARTGTLSFITDTLREDVHQSIDVYPI